MSEIEPKPSTPSILVVDNEAESPVPLILKIKGYQVSQVLSAEAALDILHQGILPDLILTDFQLLGHNTGIDLVEAIISDPNTQHIPIILHTAHDPDYLTYRLDPKHVLDHIQVFSKSAFPEQTLPAINQLLKPQPNSPANQ